MLFRSRNYKAAIYKIIKDKNPLLNNFDRAVEMEKSITLETLKSINIEKVSKEIEKHLSEKSVSINVTPKSEKSEKSEKPEKSKKSTKSVKSKKTKTESSISLTSDSQSIEFSSVSQF